MPKQKGEGNWKQLLLACQIFGKDNVIAKLESYHKVLEELSISLWAEPKTQYKTHKLDLMLLKQDETLIRLRQMSDDDIRISLETNKVGVHY